MRAAMQQHSAFCWDLHNLPVLQGYTVNSAGTRVLRDALWVELAVCSRRGGGELEKCTKNSKMHKTCQSEVRTCMRPPLPRMSSSASGFFFCGMRDDPVAYASEHWM